jgi:hypothetical protein
LPRLGFLTAAAAAAVPDCQLCLTTILSTNHGTRIFSSYGLWRWNKPTFGVLCQRRGRSHTPICLSVAVSRTPLMDDRATRSSIVQRNAEI